MKGTETNEVRYTVRVTEGSTGCDSEKSCHLVFQDTLGLGYQVRCVCLCHKNKAAGERTRHTDLKPDEYCDRIAKNYEEKLPLIFGKWNFLKSQLGRILLFDSFDLLIYEKAGSKSS
ncbi:MAG TPA: hypothetical protein VFI73_08040 [Candidatus Nitrosopolaris sp.]|nr:hypothetical protein [Candidatus Nitrosopolaris sp.]